MRKTFTFLCAALMSMSMFAQDPSWLRSGDEWDEVTKTLTVKSDLGYQAYESRSSILHLVIADGVTVIGTQAFQHCGEIVDVVIPASVTSIGGDAFYDCQNVTNVYCYPDPADLNWNDDYCDDFKPDHATNCHVKSSYLDTYNTKWGNTPSSSSNSGVNVTFAGDLTDPEQAQTTTTITWEKSDIINLGDLECNNVDQTKTANAIDGITFSITKTSAGETCKIYNQGDLWITNCGEATFTSTVGNITKIVITHSEKWNTEASTGWIHDDKAKTFTWQGTPSSAVTISGNIDFVISSIEFTVESAAAPADLSVSTITWENTDLQTLDLSMEGGKFIKDIVVMASCADVYNDNVSFNNSNGWPGFSMNNNGLLTFTPASGRLTSIVITCDMYPEDMTPLATGWTWISGTKELTWEGDAESVVLQGDASSTPFTSGPITSIVFTVKDAAAPAANSVTWTTPMVKSVDLYQNSGTAYAPLSVEMRDVTASISAGQSGAYAHFKTQGANTNISLHDGGTLTFSSETREFESIVINFDSENGGVGYANYPTEWNSIESTLTWAATPTNSVVLEDALVSHITSIVFTYATAPEPDPMPSGPSFTWEQRQVNHVKMNCDYGETETTPVIKNIITSLTKTNNIGNCYFGDWGYGQFEIMDGCGTLAFQSIVGDLTGIIITCSSVNYADDLSADWRYDSETGKLIWVGTPAETVTLSGDIKITISSIEFFYDPAPAPRLGEIINGLYEITGAHTAKVFTAAGSIPDYIEDDEVTYYITEIGDYAYYNDPTEGYFYFGANIAKVGAHAFEGCSRAIEFTFYSTVLDEIGDEAFKDCKLLGWLNFDTQMPPVLGSNAFSGDGFLNHINVYPVSSVLDAYKAAAGWSTYADKITLSNPFPATIGEQFFFDNQNTTNIYEVSSVSPKEIKVMPYTAEVNALYPITRTGTLIIPEEASYLNTGFSVTGIGANAYKDSARFDVVMIPQAVKSIEAGAFLNCTGVEKVFFLWDDPTAITWADGSVGAEFKTAASHGTQIFVPAGRLAAYQTRFPAWADCMFEGELVDVTATQDPHYQARYYRTFYDSQTDYMMPPSVWAHAGYVQGNEFILHPVAFDGQILPRGTAVVLESETPEYRLIPTGNTAPLYTGPNDLIGTDVSILRTSVGNSGENVYVLGSHATINDQSQVGMGLYRYTGTNLGAHKAYLIYNASSGPNPNNAPVRFVFKHEQTTTGIEDVQSNNVPSKILRNGQLIILKGDKEYNAQGQTIK